MQNAAAVAVLDGVDNLFELEASVVFTQPLFGAHLVEQVSALGLLHHQLQTLLGLKDPRTLR